MVLPSSRFTRTLSDTLEAAMSDHWTLTLSEEGSEEVLKEQESREAETPQRLAMLERVRNAARSLGQSDTRTQLTTGPKSTF